MWGSSKHEAALRALGDRIDKNSGAETSQNVDELRHMLRAGWFPGDGLPDQEARTYISCLCINLGADAAAAVPELIVELRDRREPVRRYACQALAAIGSAASPAESELFRLLGDGPDCRMAAAEALCAIGRPEPAVAVFEELASIDPGSERADLARIWLERLR